MIARAGTTKYHYGQEHLHIYEAGHYCENYGGFYLGFTESFRAQHLPGEMRETDHAKDLRVVLLDTDAEQETLYEVQMVVAYAKDQAMLVDTDFNYSEATCLMPYFYGGHY